MRLAGIDIGTLTCRLLIADVTDSGRLVERASDRRVLRLGEGLAATKRLGEAAMSRVLGTLEDWKGILERERVDDHQIVATSAVREARNADEFLRRVSTELGWTVRVVSGEEEARLSLLGIRFGVSLPPDARLLGLDIGGGSTELMLESTAPGPAVRSIDLGVVTLSERLLHGDPLPGEQVDRARETIRSELEPIRRELGNVDGTRLVGTAGTITTVAAMVQKLTRYERARVHDFTLSLATVRDLEKDLLARTSAQRRGLPGLEPGREDVIVAGVLILRGVMEIFGYDACLVSDDGLREGIVLDLAAKKGLAVRGEESGVRSQE